MSEKSSGIRKNHKKYSLFIGRWQPFHLGHKHIIDRALKEGENVAIAIRETELSNKNPFTVEEREEMIKELYGDKVKVFPICDIKSINIGRNVGYEVRKIEVPDEVKKISATSIREKLNSNRIKEISEDLNEEVFKYLTTVSPTFWFFGLPCSGKSTLAKQLKEVLHNKKKHVLHFDGDLLRKGINQDLGFSDKDRKENLRRAAHLAKMFNSKGHTIICSFITPTQEMRDMIRSIVPNLCFIYTKCSLEECEKRDIKGMYKKAREGKIKNFTGINAPFEEPKDIDIVVDTEKYSPQDCLHQIIKEARQIRFGDIDD